jgi:hypothetical protein
MSHDINYLALPPFFEKKKSMTTKYAIQYAIEFFKKILSIYIDIFDITGLY